MPQPAPAPDQALARPRVDREDHRDRAGELGEHLDRGAELLRVVDQRRAVQGDEHEVPALHRLRPSTAGAVRAVEQPKQAVDHRVADELHAVARDPLGRAGSPPRPREVQSSTSETRSVTTRLTSSGISQSRERRPDSMWATGDVQLGRGQRRRQGGVDVARDQDQVGGMLEQVGLDAGQRGRRLLGVGPRADAEVGVGLAHPEPLDEPAREGLVVVLARVQEADRDPLGLLQRGDHRSRLDEVRPRAHDREHRGSHSGAT